MILFNPGGPGGSGVDTILNAGSLLRHVTGTNFDLVGFDPRGIGSSVPLANCSAPAVLSPLRRRLLKITGPELPDAVLEKIYVQSRKFGDICQVAMGGPDEAGPHMSTAVVVKDMISIVDAFACSKEGKRVKNAHLLNYGGFSYGTFIGETFATLFPDRVGRFVLDGVLDPLQYTNSSTVATLEFLDDVWSTYFVYCHAAGPLLCPYYTGNSAVDIYNRFERSFSQLDVHYALAQNWTNATVIGEALALTKKLIEGAVYGPKTLFPKATPLLLGLEGALKNHTLDSFLRSASDTLRPSTALSVEAQIGVFCSDNNGLFYNRTFEALKPDIRALEKESVIGGETFAQTVLDCAGWPIKGVDVYLGELPNCILVVSQRLTDEQDPLAV